MSKENFLGENTIFLTLNVQYYVTCTIQINYFYRHGLDNFAIV